MVVTIGVFAIPTLREENLVANTILALVDVREVNILALSVGGIVCGSSTVVYVTQVRTYASSKATKDLPRHIKLTAWSAKLEAL